jgi:hypothetical protein
MTSKWAVVAGIIVMSVVVVIAFALSEALRERAETDASPKSARQLRFWSRLLSAGSSAAPLTFILSLSDDGLRDMLAALDWPTIAMFAAALVVGPLIAKVVYANLPPNTTVASGRLAVWYAFALVGLAIIFVLPLGLASLGVPRPIQVCMQFAAFTAFFFVNDSYFKRNASPAKVGNGK